MNPSPRVDPVTLAILKGRLEGLADEMDATLYRSAFNPIIAEARDACHGLYDAQTGDTLVQGTKGLPIFVGAMSFAVKAVIDLVNEEVAHEDGERLSEGDTFLFNDPYLGGTHLNDVRLVRPVFRGGTLFCWLASAGHWLDLGGNVAGGYNPKATESFQEGMRVPPLKLARGGRLDRGLLALLAANSRVPQSNWGDLNGQLNALDLGEKRLHALLDESGDATVTAAFAQFSDRAEALMREAVRALPDGRFEASDVLDNDGITPEPLPISLSLTIEGERMTLDFTASAPAAAGPINISRATTVAAVYVALKHLFPEVPANAGCLRPVTVLTTEGGLLDAKPPRPMAGYTETILRLIGVVFAALGQADPSRALGGPFGTINALSFAGAREDGSRFVMFSFFGGGLGASPVSDGLSHANNPISTATIPPAEILEAAYPVMFTQWALRPDSGGDGAHRGGLGAIYEFEALRDGTLALLGERGTVPPGGVAGGGPAAPNRFRWQEGGEWRTPPLVSKVTDVSLKAGARARLETPGGGGWGDPAERDPAARERDRKLGYVTAGDAP